MYLSYDGLTDPLGQSQILPYLIHLADRGYKIRIISFEKPDLYEQKKHDIDALIQSKSIHWMCLQYTKRPPVISTLRDITKLRKAVTKIINEEKPAIIHCRSYIPSIVAQKQCRRNKIKFLFDMRGFYADERVEGNIWPLKNPVYKWVYNYFKRKEKQFFQFSDSVVSLTQNAKSVILKWDIENVTEDKINVIPCCADFTHFNIPDQAVREANRKKLGIDHDTLVLTYLGSLGTWYLVHEMLDFYKRLKERKPNSKFLIISYQDISDYSDYYQSIGLDSTDIVNFRADRDKLPDCLSVTDFGISFIKPSFSKKASSPTKVGEMLAMGIPMVVNKNVGDMGLLFKNENLGLIVDTDNSSKFDEVIDRLLTYNLNKEIIRNEAFKVLDLLEVGVKNYEKTYKYLIEKNENLFLQS